jgi:uncharacterized RDD family membrane protein YckC
MDAGDGRIFVSYRREDSAHVAGRLADRLIERFGAGKVFVDVDSLEPGVDFTESIERAVEACNVLLAVIGENWADVTDEQGQRRLEDPSDFVVLEIRAALERDLRVIPVLVDDARMPRPDQLPPALERLTRRHAVRVHHESFRRDIDGLVKVMEETISRAVKQAKQAGGRQGEPGGATGDRPDGTGHSAPSVMGPDVRGTDVFDDAEYVAGLAAVFTRRWPEAVELLTRVSGRYPDQPQVAQRLRQAQTQLRLVEWEGRAGAAAEEHRWADAVQALEQIYAVDPEYQNAAGRLAQARRARQIADLQADLRRLHDAGQWRAVVAVGEELATLDAASADPDGLVAAAQTQLVKADQARRYATALHHLDLEAWEQAEEILEALRREDPDYEQSRALLVFAREQLGRRQEYFETLASDLHAELDRRQHLARLADIVSRAGGHDQFDLVVRRVSDVHDATAMIEVGNLLESRAEPAEAEYWYRRAAARGQPDAVAKLQQLPHPDTTPTDSPGDADAQETTAPESPASHLNKLATWRRRAAAGLIDLLTVLPAYILILIYSTQSVLIGVLLFAGVKIYSRWYLQGVTGQSWGKHACRLMLVSIHDGQPIGFGPAVRRGFAHLIDMITLGVGYLYPIWDRRKQTLADKMNKTIVISVGKKSLGSRATSD